MFDTREMGNHLTTSSHISRQEECDSDTWYANYGRTPTSKSLELAIFKNFPSETREFMFSPIRQGVSGCTDIPGPEEQQWEKEINMFLPTANLKAVIFDSSATTILARLRHLTFGLLNGCTSNDYKFRDHTFNHIIVGIADSFVASDLYRSQSQGMVIVAEDSMIKTLTALMEEQLVVAVVYDHMRYTDLTLRSKQTFLNLHEWCSNNHAALICDETLSFLMRAPSFSFADGIDKVPDFIVVGKFVSVSCLLATDYSKRLFGVRVTGEANTDSNNFKEFLAWANNIVTTRCDHVTLLRSTRILQWVNKNKADILENIELMNAQVPEIFGRAKLPTPTGHGFVWFFDEKSCDALKRTHSGKQVCEKLSFSNKMYLYLDTSPVKMDAMLSTCTGKGNKRMKM